MRLSTADPFFIAGYRDIEVWRGDDQVIAPQEERYEQCLGRWMGCLAHSFKVWGSLYAFHC
jgi:hypothetical protein